MPDRKEEWKIYKNVFDQFTIETLFRLITQGHFEGLVHQIEVGKESNVFVARKGDEKVIVKIYRLESCNFNKMYDYIKSDPRVRVKKQRRKVIFSWVQREYRNLIKAREAMNVPTPITVMHNVLVMEHIGDSVPAPQLKDMPPKDPKDFLKRVISGMKKLAKVGLVHGDISEYNILNYNERPYFIDFSQATSTQDPNSVELLRRDVKNICRYWRRLGEDLDEEKTYKTIASGLEPAH